MLFILDKTSEHFFWMKGMEFGLDMLFFDRDRRLIKILPNLVPCEECTKYKTPANTAYALEINAGMADLCLQRNKTEKVRDRGALSPLPWNKFMIDIHCHILPAIDTTGLLIYRRLWRCSGLQPETE